MFLQMFFLIKNAMLKIIKLQMDLPLQIGLFRLHLFPTVLQKVILLPPKLTVISGEEDQIGPETDAPYIVNTVVPCSVVVAKGHREGLWKRRSVRFPTSKTQTP